MWGGRIRLGDSVIATERSYRALSALPRERLWDVVSRIPSGMVATYTALILAIGVPRTWVRALPRVLLRGPETLPAHRVVDSCARPITQHIPDQLERLAAEGTRVLPSGVFGKTAQWNVAFAFTGEETVG